MKSGITNNEQPATNKFLSGRVKGEKGDLGWAVEAEGQAYGADAAVDVELHLVEAIEALGIFLAEWGQDDRTQKREPDLAAVRVAGEHEVDEWTAGMLYDVVGVVGLMRHEDDGAVGFRGYGEVEIGMAGVGVVCAA